ncbi:hypothetical protein IF1G_01465 [Cordyceps javanica]|uniref:Uncharacterized protein n=1 Tax=Cordyceps javanica TaxID=43265 RepID=A0A545VBY1_9HYPO|nr:hypothetical protein IF1G_01465 [Cordyceps javanica]
MKDSHCAALLPLSPHAPVFYWYLLLAHPPCRRTTGCYRYTTVALYSGTCPVQKSFPLDGANQSRPAHVRATDDPPVGTGST